eukprot:3126116-Pyramimonas_sp.AAC.1
MGVPVSSTRLLAPNAASALMELKTIILHLRCIVCKGLDRWSELGLDGCLRGHNPILHMPILTSGKEVSPEA